MRIVHIITRLDCGGSAENTLLSAIGQRKLGHEVSIVCGNSDNPESANERIAREMCIVIRRSARLVRRISPVSDVLALIDLYRFLRSSSCDIVHTHTSKAGIVGRCAAAAARVRHIVHTPHGHIFYGYFSRSLTMMFTWLERLLMGRTDALITLTEQEKRDYLDRGFGPPAKIHPVLSGIELQRFLDPPCTREQALTNLGLRPHHFVIGTVARLVDVKNHDLILRAAGLLRDRSRDLRFVFVGDGELRPSLEFLAGELQLGERVVFAGWRSDVASVLPAFDIFVMCSKNEGMGRAFVEAQAAGIPVIGSRTGGIPEVLRDGETGFLVSPDDPRELADKIWFFHDRRAMLPQWADRCRAWAQSRFSADTMVRSIEEIYNAVLGGSAS